MAHGTYRFHVGGVPVLKIHAEPRPVPAVVVLHGLGASADRQRKELVALADSGFAAVGLDAPHHGARADGWLERFHAADAATCHGMLLELVREAASEVPRVLDHLQAEGHGPLGLLGISMGAYTALAAAVEDARVRATVSMLGSPDWSPRRDDIPHHALEAHAPVHHAERLLRHPVLFINAGKDVNVPARFSRDFVHRVDHVHATYVEYPRSSHFMEPADWEDAFARSVAFLRRHLVS